MEGKVRSASPPTERVIAIVELVAGHATPMTGAEIADELGLSRSTAAAVLNVLTERGWLRRAPDMRYRTGAWFDSFAASALGEPAAPANAVQVLDELAGEVGCGAALGLVGSDELKFVTVTAGPGRLPAGITAGTALPLRAPAGAAVVAFRDAEQQDRWLGTALAAHRDRLVEALHLIRSTGVAAWGIDAASSAELDVLAEVVEHLADHPAPRGLRTRVLALLAGIGGQPYCADEIRADARLPLSYLVAPVFDAGGHAVWELQIGPLREEVDLAERTRYTTHLHRAAQCLSESTGGPATVAS